MERMVPGEAHAAMHLDRALACGDRGLRGIRFRRARGELGLPVILGDAPRGPVRERARELRLHIRVGELVRDRLVRADRPAELLAAFRVLDPELERPARDADGLEGERRQRSPERRASTTVPLAFAAADASVAVSSPEATCAKRSGAHPRAGSASATVEKYGPE